MSQAKVDRYKEEKANRKEIMKRQKRKRAAVWAATVVICAAVIGLIAFSGYKSYQAKQPRDSYEVNYTSIDEYLSGLTAED